MSGKKKDFLLNLAVGAAIAAVVFGLGVDRGFEITRCVCDGLFVAAVMLLGIGGIRGVRNKGAFDVTGYGIKSAIETIPLFRHGEREDLEQYRQRKAKERKDAGGMILAGAVYLVLSLAALGIYHAVQ